MSRHDEAPVVAGACRCSKPCLSCHCQNTSNPTQNQAIASHLARVAAALDRFAAGKRGAR